ncbi:MAG TPA: hypothetical protein VF077_04040, partial [Nitrospiraceae bacterium]
MTSSDSTPARWMSGQNAESHRLGLHSIFRCNRGILPAGQEQIFIEANFTEAADMLMSWLFLLILIGFPLSAFAQFLDKGNRVEVMKGTKLCSNVKMEQAKGSRDPVRVFWVVKSKMRSNGTQ